MSGVINKHRAGMGLRWLIGGWRLFTRSWGVFVGMTLLLTVIMLVTTFVPLLGQLAVTLFGPVFAGGFFYAYNRVADGHKISVGDLFAAFRSGAPTGPLLGLGGLSLVFYALMFLFIVVMGSAMMMGMDAAELSRFEHFDPQTTDPRELLPAIGPLFFVAGGLALILTGLWYAAMAFAVPQVAFNSAGPINALGTSLKASLINWLPLLVSGLLSFLALLVAVPLTFGLAMLVLGPWMGASLYCAWRDIFLPQAGTSVVQA